MIVIIDSPLIEWEVHLNYWTKWVMDACISSSTRPFVSGTNKTAEPHIPAREYEKCSWSSVAKKLF